MRPVIAALLRLWPQLPALVGDDWPAVERRIAVLFARMETASDTEREVLASTLLMEFRPYRRVSAYLRGLLELTDDDRRVLGDSRREPPWPSLIEGYREIAQPIEPGEPSGGAEPRRYVNTRLCIRDTEVDVPRDQPLRPLTGYDLLVNVGGHDARSLLTAAEAAFPDDRLPPGGLWLTLVVHVPGVLEQPQKRDLFLPEQGDSFVCPCAPLTATHQCTGAQRRPYAIVALTSPPGPKPVLVRLAIYYHAAVVEVHELSLPMSDGAQFGAHTVYSLTRSFGDLGPFRDRALSVFAGAPAAEAGSRIYVNGVSIDPMTFAYGDQQADSACRIARNRLFDTHLKEQDGGWQSTYDGNQAKDQAGFESDLLALARVGRMLHSAVFGRGDAPQIRQMLLQQAAAGPALVQCGRMAGERLAMPWQLIYDLPMQSGDANPFRCPSVREFGPAGRPPDDVPGICPHETEHPRVGQSVLCPFGFWGLAHIVEVPPHMGEERGLPHLVSDGSSPVATLVGWNRQPSPRPKSVAEAQRHLDALRGYRLGVLSPEIESRDELGRRLGDPDLDLVYLYCHCDRETVRGATTGTAVLVLGNGDRFKPDDVRQWNGYYDWPWPHWADRRPLVVLNACHTGEILAATLADFVGVFVETAGAAGVVTTEVTVEQGLAGLAMELFLAALADNVAVGAAMRRMRWALLARGNVMGLAYSPYCAADLSLRGPAAA